MPSDPEFRADLYRGTARFYDQFRLRYPGPLLDDLRVRAAITGTGRLLDLACGTGQVTFDLASSFASVWAVDQEPEAVELARAKALRRGVENVRWIAGRAEDVDAESSFELVTIGNAFHRLPRRAIAESAIRWLVPGGHLALLWSNPPWGEGHEWQRILTDTIGHWMREAATTERIPADLAQQLTNEPHTTVLATAGYTVVGKFDFAAPHEWSIEELTGFMYSTSVLSQAALGPNVEAFERDLRDRLLAVEPDGVFREEVSFSYTLARSPSLDPSPREVLDAMVRMFETGDVSEVGRVVAEDYADHQGLGGSPLMGRGGFVSVVEAARSGYQHLDIVIVDAEQTGSRVVATIRWHGIRPDGSAVDRQTQDEIRVVNGQAVEHWGRRL